MPNEKSSSSVVSNFFRCSSDSTEYASCAVTSGDRISYSEGVMAPSIRNSGGTTSVMCRSDAVRWIMSSSSCLSVVTRIPFRSASDVVRRRLLEHFLRRGDALPELRDPVHAQRVQALGQRLPLERGRRGAIEDQVA